MRILFLSRWFPYPADNGSKIRIYNLLRGLAADYHDVTLLSFSDQPIETGDAPELRALCRDIQIVLWEPYIAESRKARLGFFSLTPRFLVDTFSTEMMQRIEDNFSINKFDLVIASQLSMASYSPSFHNTPALFDEIELSLYFEPFSRTTSYSSSVRHGLTWTKYRHYISKLLRNFKACTVVSEQEREILLHAVSDH